eukprot:403359583
MNSSKLNTLKSSSLSLKQPNSQQSSKSVIQKRETPVSKTQSLEIDVINVTQPSSQIGQTIANDDNGNKNQINFANANPLPSESVQQNNVKQQPTNLNNSLSRQNSIKRKSVLNNSFSKQQIHLQLGLTKKSNNLNDSFNMNVNNSSNLQTSSTIQNAQNDANLVKNDSLNQFEMLMNSIDDSDQRVQESPLKKHSQKVNKKLDKVKVAREEILIEIVAEEEEKQQIEEQMKLLELRLKQINSSLQKTYQIRDQYNKTIKQGEIGISKLQQSSQSLNYVLKRESKTLFSLKDKLDLENQNKRKIKQQINDMERQRDIADQLNDSNIKSNEQNSKQGKENDDLIEQEMIRY